ncbi:sigma-54-dependent Fis family transcriptional regulator [Candidatus Binatus sp.]|uniref:sigma-54 interaction domain-containing protein n=1 Tax=Candidatus Binatus sp. TaxID=2811406 RepID=UPI00272AE358|nr:sigma-54 dependent transcriptional regulator [Candidatus Binatus sp.]
MHFGDARSLTKPEFLKIFGTELDTTMRDLLACDMETFAIDMGQIGRMLAERGVPFSELIVSMHLFEESATAFFPSFPPSLPKLYQSFDKLSHCRIIILADTYFRSTTAVSGARIEALEREAKSLPPDKRTQFHGLVGGAETMRKLYERIEAVGATRGTVLIVGESGTGKELVARAIHECGPNPKAPFVALNCAAIPRELIESELFGYKRGAFSGATTEYEGLFRSAEAGTLLLDEITEMSPDTQSKLLRALQERTVRPVGSTREIPVNVRLIASTNRNPDEAVSAGLLRSDLYYRLQASVLSIAPLRKRPEDVPLLVEHFIEVMNGRGFRATPVVGVEEAALEAMRNYLWPGNVRELANAIETAFTFGKSHQIQLADLPESISGRHQVVEQGAAPIHPGSFADAERDLIRRALESTGGNKVSAAKLLKISRKRLYAKIAKYHLA